MEPGWGGREGDRILVATDRRTLKGRNMDRDPRVAISITDFTNPYEQVLIRGRVIEVRDDGDLKMLDRLSHEYTGKPFARRKWPSRAIYVIEADIARHYRSPLIHEPFGGQP